MMLSPTPPSSAQRRRAGVRSELSTSQPMDRSHRFRRGRDRRGRELACTDPSSHGLNIPIPTSTPPTRDYLPFRFGAEFEVIVRPRSVEYPGPDASMRSYRDFNLSIMSLIAGLLSRAGLPCDVYDQGSDDKPDYSKWNVTLDASLSKKHIRDGFCMYPASIFSFETLTPVRSSGNCHTHHPGRCGLGAHY